MKSYMCRLSESVYRVDTVVINPRIVDSEVTL